MAKANYIACDRTNHENHSVNSKLDPSASQEPCESVPETQQSDIAEWKHSSRKRLYKTVLSSCAGISYRVTSN